MGQAVVAAIEREADLTQVRGAMRRPAHLQRVRRISMPSWTRLTW